MDMLERNMVKDGTKILDIQLAVELKFVARFAW